MRRADAYEFIQLLDDSGTPIDARFVEIEPLL